MTEVISNKNYFQYQLQQIDSSKYFELINFEIWAFHLPWHALHYSQKWIKDPEHGNLSSAPSDHRIG